MTFDFAHMIVTALILFAILWLVNHSGVFKNTSKRGKTLIAFGLIVVVIFVFNLVWPYGSGL